MGVRRLIPRRRSTGPLVDPFTELACSWWEDDGVLHGLGVLVEPIRVPFVLAMLQDSLGPGNHRVLDLGAGGGMLAESIHANGHRVVALDISHEALVAGSQHGVDIDSGVAFVQGIGRQLPFGPGSFDAVLCMEVLEHVDDPDAVIGEAARVLRPGGVFGFSGPNRTAQSWLSLIVIAQHLFGLIPRRTHKWAELVRTAEMGRMQRAAGIEPNRVVGVGVRARHLPGAVLGAFGLATRRLTYPQAASRIKLSSGVGTSMAYQGYGIRR